MGEFVPNGANQVLDDWNAARQHWVSAHTADPGTTGANEAAGGAPAYERKELTFDPAAAENLDSNNQPLIDVPAGSYSWLGLWTGPANTGGLFVAKHQIGTESGPATPRVFAAQGQLRIPDADVFVP